MPNGLEKKQYLQALEIAASEEFPFDSVSDMSYGSVCIEETENGKFYLFSVTSLQLAEGYEQFMRELGAEPSFLEPESVALARATVPEQKDAVDILLADIGARTTMLVVLGRHSQPIFSAAVPVGGDVLSTAIEEQLKISLADAEQLKRKSGFDLTVDDGRVMMIIQQPFNEIAKEIKSTIDYYKKRTGRNVRKIMLAGGTSLLPVIIDYVSSRFPGIEVVTADPLAGINISSSAPLPDNLKEEAVLYSTAIGLAQRAAGSRDRPGPDLLPRKTRSSRKKRSPLRYIRSIFKKVPSSYASK
jgi:Tfp pilus assembly PilM family ATPase